MRLHCVDLFCGAGGFSEGFRQAGIHVSRGIDLWPPAFVTHKKNHCDGPGGIRDVAELRPRDLGDVDILIGSPPCTEFSFANRGGGGDLEAGLRLVRSFLRLVYLKRPRWWVMENVPRTLEFVGDRVPLRDLGIDRPGALEIPVRGLLASADFGVPQQRMRAFFGNVPLPSPTHAAEGAPTDQRWRTLGDVLRALGDPEREPSSGEIIRDPVYGFEVPATSVTDHYSRSLRLTEEEVREARQAKTDHSWYGRMAFPDRLDRPARTVMATQLRVSRETIVVPTEDGHFRRLSVREMASCMGFPVTYQFWGRTEALRYKLVGNAVAPPVARAIAHQVLKAAGARHPSRPIVRARALMPAPPVTEGAARRRKLPLKRRFRAHVPGSRVPGFRVDLDNQGSSPGRHLVEWRTVLYRGGGKALRQEQVDLETALHLMALTVADADTRQRVRDAFADLERLEVPDATTLQRVRAEQIESDLTPYTLVERIGEIVSRHFASQPRVVRLDVRRDRAAVPPRIAATLVAAAYVCARANGRGRRPLRLPRATGLIDLRRAARGA